MLPARPYCNTGCLTSAVMCHSSHCTWMSDSLEGAHIRIQIFSYLFDLIIKLSFKRKRSGLIGKLKEESFWFFFKLFRNDTLPIVWRVFFILTLTACSLGRQHERYVRFKGSIGFRSVTFKQTSYHFLKWPLDWSCSFSWHRKSQNEGPRCPNRLGLCLPLPGFQLVCLFPRCQLGSLWGHVAQTHWSPASELQDPPHHHSHPQASLLTGWHSFERPRGASEP